MTAKKKKNVYLYHLFPGCNHDGKLSYVEVCHQSPLHLGSIRGNAHGRCQKNKRAHISCGVFRRGELWLRQRGRCIAAGVGVCKVKRCKPAQDGLDCERQIVTGWVTAHEYTQATARRCLHCLGEAQHLAVTVAQTVVSLFKSAVSWSIDTFIQSDLFLRGIICVIKVWSMSEMSWSCPLPVSLKDSVLLSWSTVCSTWTPVPA